MEYALCPVLLALACGWNAAMAAPSGVLPAGVSRPAAIYHNYCSVCHGEKGDGQSRAKGSFDRPPRDFTSISTAQLPRDSMIATVTHGRPGTAMVAWSTQLTGQEIEAVVDYIRKTFMQPDSKAPASAGRRLYTKNCSVCHGEKGDGQSRAKGSFDRPPRDFTSVSTAQLPRDSMIATVTHGRPGTAMVSFGTQLGKGDIETIVDFIRETFMLPSGAEGISGTHAREPRTQAAQEKAAPKSASPATPTDMSLPFSTGLKGNPDKGAVFYMQNCATCHGAGGGGDGPRAYFINPPPRNFLLETSRQRLNRPALFQAISQGSQGTEMPAWNKVLDNQEIADVAEFVFQRFIRSPQGGKGEGSGGK